MKEVYETYMTQKRNVYKWNDVIVVKKNLAQSIAWGNVQNRCML